MTKSLAQMEESARHQSVHDLKKVLGPALLTVVRTPCFEAAARLVSTVQWLRFQIQQNPLHWGLYRYHPIVL